MKPKLLDAIKRVAPLITLLFISVSQTNIYQLLFAVSGENLPISKVFVPVILFALLNCGLFFK